MAGNTTFQIKRSSVAGKLPNTSTLSTGELGLNLTDQKIYSSNGSGIFEPAANTSTLYIGNSTVSSITANSSAVNIAALTTHTANLNSILIIANNVVSQLTTTVTTIPVANLSLTSTSAQSQLFTGTGNQNVILPNATTLINGWVFNINNNSSGNVSVYANDGTTLIKFITAGAFFQISLLTNTTTNGTWDTHSFIPTGITWGSANLAMATINITGVGSIVPNGNTTTYGNTTNIIGTIYANNINANGNIILNTTAAISANGSYGTANQVLTTNGTGVYWANTTSSGGTSGSYLQARQRFVANGTSNTFTVTSGYSANNLDVYLNGVKLQNGVEANVLNGSTFTILTGNPANGSVIEVVGASTLLANGVSTVVNQQITANGSANSFAITGGYVANSILVFLNGVKQIPGTDVIITSGANVGFATTPANNYIIDVYGYQTSVSYTSNTVVVGNTSIGLNNISVGNSTVNTTITANGVSISNTLVVSGTSTYTGAATFSNTVTFSSDIVPATSYKRNRIINGNMAADQRNAGAAQTITAGAALAYSVDRWYAYCTGANVTGQQVAGATANQYRYRFTGAASVTAIGFAQRIEAINSADLAGTTATLSVDLANSLLTTVTWTAYYANTTDTFGSLASPTVTSIATGTFTITSTVTRYNAQISIPSAATTGLQIVLSVGAQTSGTWTIGSVQLEVGTIATPYERQIYSDQYAQCQRYYQAANGVWGSYYGSTAAGTYAPVILPVTMRATPTVTFTASGGGGYSSVTVAAQTPAAFAFQPTPNATGFVNFNYSYTSIAEL